MTIKTFFCLFFFTSVTAFGQNKNEFTNFIKSFPSVELPDTIQYSDAEFSYGYYDCSSNTSDAKDTAVKYQDGVLSKDDSLIINYALAKEILLGDTGRTDDEGSNDSTQAIFYITSRIITHKNFYCIVYEEQKNPRYSAWSIAHKYLCTFTKKGKLINQILVASADYSGTGILCEGFRVPFYPNEYSFITNNLKIFFYDPENHDIIYQIDKRGRIKKIRQY